MIIRERNQLKCQVFRATTIDVFLQLWKALDGKLMPFTDILHEVREEIGSFPAQHVAEELDLPFIFGADSNPDQSTQHLGRQLGHGITVAYNSLTYRFANSTGDR